MHFEEALREIGIGLGVAAPISIAAFFLLRVYVRAETAELRRVMQQNLDATIIELRDTHVTLSEFHRHAEAVSMRHTEISRQLEKLHDKVDRLLERENHGNHGR